MFRKNTQHQQPALISAVSDLPEKQRRLYELAGIDLGTTDWLTLFGYSPD